MRLIRRSLLAGLAALPVAARAQAQPPLAFLQGLYEPYKQKDFKGQPYWETARWFVADLAQAIDRDFAEAEKRKEVPKLDGDPFINAQDWDIRAVNYAVTEMKSANRAAGAIAFDNLGTATLVAVFLVQTPQGWRIDDIVTRGSSLRAFYGLH
jgi:hypothetical protein